MTSEIEVAMMCSLLYIFFKFWNICVLEINGFITGEPQPNYSTFNIKSSNFYKHITGNDLIH